MESPPSGEAGRDQIEQPTTDRSVLAASLRPNRIARNIKNRGDIWRRLLEMRQARKDREEEEVLKLISQAKSFLKRKKEIEQAMSTMQKMSALRNLGPMGPLEETQSRDHKKLSFSRKKRPRPVVLLPHRP